MFGLTTININFLTYLLPIIFILFFVLVAYHLLKGRKYIIDINNKTIYYGLPHTNSSYNIGDRSNPNKPAMIFDNIYAVQLLCKKHVFRGNGRGGSTSFIGEINFVLKDSTRINLVTNSNLDAIREDARIIASELNIPVRDNTQRGYEAMKKIKELRNAILRVVLGVFLLIVVKFIMMAG